MADVHSPQSEVKHAGNTQQNTAIEKMLSQLLNEAGIPYSSYRPAGKPDFVLDEYKAAIFVHGCFWHRHDCYLFKVPATRTDFG